jgi:hypothetical protein
VHYPEIGNCWEWTGGVFRGGYGHFKVSGDDYYAHRLSWLLAYGSISDDKPFILHRCDNPPCVRPDHLFAGTTEDNMQDMLTKGRWNGGRPRGGDREGETHVCIACGRKRKDKGRGLCGACNEYHRNKGTLDQFPSKYEWRNTK